MGFAGVRGRVWGGFGPDRVRRAGPYLVYYSNPEPRTQNPESRIQNPSGRPMFGGQPGDPLSYWG